MRTPTALAAAGALTLVVAATTRADLIGPLPYLSAADSPFASAGLSSFFLEDFEDGLLNTPGLSASAGLVASPGDATDSVDGDDGAIDGLGRAGRSWYLGVTTVTFTFAPVAGEYPTHAGLVWTDIGAVTSGAFGTGSLVFEAFAPDGTSIAGTPGVPVGDGDFLGQTAEDRFLGAINLAGIASITVSVPSSQDWELDHIQYGTIPAPSAGALAAAGLALAIRRRRA